MSYCPTGGDLTGIMPNTTVAKLQGVSVSAVAPTTSQILLYNGTAWTPTLNAPLNATNAANVLVTSSTTNATYFPTFVSSTSGNAALRVSSGNNITYNPSTKLLKLSALTPSYAVVTDASSNLISLRYTPNPAASTIISRDTNDYSYVNNIIEGVTQIDFATPGYATTVVAPLVTMTFSPSFTLTVADPLGVSSNPDLLLVQTNVGYQYVTCTGVSGFTYLGCQIYGSQASYTTFVGATVTPVKAIIGVATLGFGANEPKHLSITGPICSYPLALGLAVNTIGQAWELINQTNNSITIIGGLNNRQLVALIPPKTSMLLTYNSSDPNAFNPFIGGNIGTYPIPWDNIGTPSSICFDGTYIWIAITITGTVCKYSTGGSLQATYSTGATSLGGMCFDGTNIWVANRNAASVSKIDNTGTVTTYAVGTSPHKLCFDGTYIWISLYAVSSSIQKMTTSGVVVATYSTGFIRAGDILFDGTNIWVNHEGSSFLSKLNISTGVVTSIAITSISSSIIFDGKYVWSVADSPTLLRILATGTTVTTINIPQHSNSLAFDGTYLWLSISGNSTMILSSSGDIIDVYLGFSSRLMCYDGLNMWIDRGYSLYKIPTRSKAPIGIPQLCTNTIATRDINANAQINNLNMGFTSTVTSANAVYLALASSRQQYFTGSTTQTVALPDVTTLSLGHQFKIINLSSATITFTNVSLSVFSPTRQLNTLSSVYITCISLGSAPNWSFEYGGSVSSL